MPRKESSNPVMTIPPAFARIIAEANSGKGIPCTHCEESLASSKARAVQLSIVARRTPSTDPAHGPCLVRTVVRCGACGEVSSIDFNIGALPSPQLALALAQDVSFSKGGRDV
jgi:hypothetical protein